MVKIRLIISTYFLDDLEKKLIITKPFTVESRALSNLKGIINKLK